MAHARIILTLFYLALVVFYILGPCVFKQENRASNTDGVLRKGLILTL